MAYELCSTLDDVVDNVRRFNKELREGKDIITQLSQFKHWYFIPELELFGPSKFVGYKNMTTNAYNRGRSKSGVDTEARLKRWFKILPTESEAHADLGQELADFLAAFDKRLNSAAHIHVPIGWDPSSRKDYASLLLEVFKTASSRTGGIGESETHKALKLKLAAHPELLGLSSQCKSELERVFLSGDRVDILFQDDKQCVVVEVELQGLHETLGGLFQAIKYRALRKPNFG